MMTKIAIISDIHGNREALKTTLADIKRRKVGNNLEYIRNIDTSTERLIQKSIDKLSKEKTAIFIAHRLSTIVNVDKILVLKDGEIIEQGTHKQLLEKHGYYSNLYNSYYESLGGI